MNTASLRYWPTVGGILLAGVSIALVAAQTNGSFVSIFDGKTLKGWHVSAKTGHSRASKNQTGGKWVVENGAIVGSQDIPGNGGIVITDEPFGDFEVELEMNNDFGPDSGLFLRSTEDGKAWQAMIDYHSGGNVMGIYGEGLGGKPSVRNYSFLDSPDRIKIVTNSPVPLPVSPEQWPAFWKHGRWNKFRARIVGNPPQIITWINGVRFMEWQETEIRHPATGGIALQVHGGGDHTKEFVRYRNIRVKRLDAGKRN
jgi:3-keto-disaccharide hydrolase